MTLVSYNKFSLNFQNYFSVEKGDVTFHNVAWLHV
jgi:hypothetical protein